MYSGKWALIKKTRGESEVTLIPLNGFNEDYVADL